MPNLQALWAHYDEASERPHTQRNQYFESAVSYGKVKLNSYFNLVLLQPDVSFYAVATALHPKLRLGWFKTQWKHFPHWYRKAETSIRRVFKQYTEAAEEAEDELYLPAPSRRKLAGGGNNTLYERTMEVDLHLLTNAKGKRTKRVSQLNEYFDSLLFDYTSGSETELLLLNSDDPWAWWLQVGRERYPMLFKVTGGYLSIPSTSCECERSFSKARRTISDDRNKLGGTTIEAIQLQKSWLRHGVVKSSLNDLEILVKKADKHQLGRVAASQASDSFSAPSRASSSFGQSESSYCQ